MMSENTELDALTQMVADLYPYAERFPTFRSIPENGRSREEILELLSEMRTEEDAMGDAGRVSGSIYHGGHDHYKFLVEAFKNFAHSNVLQRDMYPSATKFEGEIVAMTASMLHGDGEVCGVITSGGTESLINPLLAYRERALEKGITEPEVIIPITAHVALEKGAHYFGIKVLHAPLGLDWKVDLEWVRSHVNKNTIALVGSAGNYPHGVIDDIEGLSQIALANQIGLHVDGCLGGWILPWFEELGHDIPRFDFRIPGVTSISADTHKFGFALKGTSVLLYRNAELRRFQYSIFPDWPGGLYASPGMSGSRSGGLIAAAWAAMVNLGRVGYLENAAAIWNAAREIETAVRSHKELQVLGNPTFLVAFRSDHFDIYHLNDALISRGWRLNSLQLPAALHFCVTLPQSLPGVTSQFARDLDEAVAYALGATGKAKSGAMYGMGGSPVGDEMMTSMMSGFMDLMCEVAPTPINSSGASE
jgi:sphinganine-1-phosphate aldolase